MLASCPSIAECGWKPARLARLLRPRTERPRDEDSRLTSAFRVVVTAAGLSVFERLGDARRDGDPL